MQRSLLITLMLLAAAPAAMARDCSPTPAIATQNYPGFARIQNSNNLLLPAGKAVIAEGQRVTIVGRLLDNGCIPISDAQIELWQVDPFGKWMLATPADLASPTAVFAGAGRTSTDNGGSFVFTTAFPAAVGKRAPNYNLRIRVRDQKPFDTVLYMGGDGRNGGDAVYSKLSLEGRQKVGLQVGESPAGLVGTTTLVVPFKVKYRGY